jgi:hypothetical protein
MRALHSQGFQISVVIAGLLKMGIGVGGRVRGRWPPPCGVGVAVGEWRWLQVLLM